MYAFLKGTPFEFTTTHMILEVNNVGYHINISLYTYEALQNKEKVFVYTWLQVKEDDLVLYGFAEQTERSMFLKLISVNGIGANTARLMLSHLSPSTLANLISSGDVGKIKAVKGIGEKTAQRIIVDLKDKVDEFGDSDTEGFRSNSVTEEVITALTTLGYTKNSAKDIVGKVMKKENREMTAEELIKLSLKLF